MVIRSTMFTVIGLFPVYAALLVIRPIAVIAFTCALLVAAYQLDLGKDFAKQWRWATRVSQKGPIFWLGAWTHRCAVRLARKVGPDACDVMPQQVTALGTARRGCDFVVLQWIPNRTSTFSSEAYELHLRETTSAGQEGGGWVPQKDGLSTCELRVSQMRPATAYDARVRACNSKGAGGWRVAHFTTKQPASNGGGAGSGYTWIQALGPEGTIGLTIDLPAGTRSKQLDVSVTPSTLRINLDGEVTLVSGTLHAPVDPDETTWEICDASSGGRQLQLSLTKSDRKGPYWPCVLRGEVEVDTSQLKRPEQSLEEMMAEYKNSEMLAGLDKVERLKREVG